MAWEDVHDRFTIEDIGAPLLANLAKGIYSPEAVLREYVQNAADAYVDLEDMHKKKLSVTEKPIDIYLQENNTLVVQDSGTGMNLQDVKHYKRIALSPKLGKDRAGFRGIGIWAGFSACDTLVVETSKSGDPHKYKLILKFEEMRKLVNQNIDVKQLLDGRFCIERDAAPASDHYTQVRLVNLHKEFSSLFRPEELERVARQILPCRIDPKFKYAENITKQLASIDGYQEFMINVKDVEVFKRFPANATEPVFQVLEGDGQEYAFVWFSTSPTVRSFKPPDASNFRLRVRNIGVGGPGIYSQEDGAHWGITTRLNSPELLDWYVGEIHLLRSDVRPNTPRSELELDTESRRTIELIRDFYDDVITYRRANSDVNIHVKQVKDMAPRMAQGPPFERPEASRILKALQKYDTLSKSKKTTLEGIDVKKRQILRDLEHKDASVLKSRRELIEHLEQIATASSRPRNGKGQSSKGYKGNRQSPDSGESPQQQPLNLGIATDYEQLLSDLLLAVEQNLGDQEELATKLSENIEEVFKRHGLLVTA